MQDQDPKNLQSQSQSASAPADGNIQLPKLDFDEKSVNGNAILSDQVEPTSEVSTSSFSDQVPAATEASTNFSDDNLYQAPDQKIEIPTITLESDKPQVMSETSSNSVESQSTNLENSAAPNESFSIAAPSAFATAESEIKQPDSSPVFNLDSNSENIVQSTQNHTAKPDEIIAGDTLIKAAEESSQAKTPLNFESPEVKEPSIFDWKFWSLTGAILVVAAIIGFSMYQQNTELFKGQFTSVPTDQCQIKLAAFRQAYEAHKAQPSDAAKKQEVWTTGADLCESEFSSNPKTATCRKYAFEALLIYEYNERDSKSPSGDTPVAHLKKKIEAANCQNVCNYADKDALKKDLSDFFSKLNGQNSTGSTSTTQNLPTTIPELSPSTQSTNISPITPSTDITPQLPTPLNPLNPIIPQSPAPALAPIPLPQANTQNIESADLGMTDAGSIITPQPLEADQSSQGELKLVETDAQIQNPSSLETPLPQVINDAQTDQLEAVAPQSTIQPAPSTDNQAQSSDSSTSLINFLVPQAFAQATPITFDAMFPNAAKHLDEFKKALNCTPPAAPADPCTLVSENLKSAVTKYNLDKSETNKTALFTALKEAEAKDCGDFKGKTACDKEIMLFTLAVKLELATDAKSLSDKIFADQTCKQLACELSKSSATAASSTIATLPQLTEATFEVQKLADQSATAPTAEQKTLQIFCGDKPTSTQGQVAPPGATDATATTLTPSNPQSTDTLATSPLLGLTGMQTIGTTLGVNIPDDSAPLSQDCTTKLNLLNQKLLAYDSSTNKSNLEKDIIQNFDDYNSTCLSSLDLCTRQLMERGVLVSYNGSSDRITSVTNTIAGNVECRKTACSLIDSSLSKSDSQKTQAEKNATTANTAFKTKYCSAVVTTLTPTTPPTCAAWQTLNGATNTCADICLADRIYNANTKSCDLCPSGTIKDAKTNTCVKSTTPPAATAPATGAAATTCDSTKTKDLAGKVAEIELEFYKATDETQKIALKTKLDNLKAELKKLIDSQSPDCKKELCAAMSSANDTTSTTVKNIIIEVGSCLSCDQAQERFKAFLQNMPKLDKTNADAVLQQKIELERLSSILANLKSADGKSCSTCENANQKVEAANSLAYKADELKKLEDERTKACIPPTTQPPSAPTTLPTIACTPQTKQNKETQLKNQAAEMYMPNITESGKKLVKDLLQTLVNDYKKDCDANFCETLKKDDGKQWFSSHKALFLELAACPSAPATPPTNVCEVANKELEDMKLRYSQLKQQLEADHAKNPADSTLAAIEKELKLFQTQIENKFIEYSNLKNASGAACISQCAQIEKAMLLRQLFGQTVELNQLKDAYAKQCTSAPAGSGSSGSSSGATTASSSGSSSSGGSSRLPYIGSGGVPATSRPTTSSQALPAARPTVNQSQRQALQNTYNQKVVELEKAKTQVKAAEVKVQTAQNTVLSATAPAEKQAAQATLETANRELAATQAQVATAQNSVEEVKKELDGLNIAMEEIIEITETGPETFVYLIGLIAAYFIHRRRKSQMEF
jgi:hypothetical protein